MKYILAILLSMTVYPLILLICTVGLIVSGAISCIWTAFTAVPTSQTTKSPRKVFNY